jgi:hypothetical protein
MFDHVFADRVGPFSRKAEIFSVHWDAALVFRIHNQYN